MPWRLDGGRAQGPGVFDMKAGIVVGMAVLTAMVRESRPHPVSLLLVPDEEVGSGSSRELTLSVARRHRRVLVLEPSQDGAAKVARKGCGTFGVRFRGRAAHAGLEPEKGASALAEMARFVLFLESLAAPAGGTTLTASVARAGSATNVVPEAAELAVDARAWTREEAERVTAAIRGYRPVDPRVSVSVEGGFDRPPLEPTVASRRALSTRPAGWPEDLGFELGAARVGGASDGNFTAAAGVPTLDGLGPRGGGAHARDEHVLVADLPLRAALLAALVARTLGPALERRDPQLERRVRREQREQPLAARDLHRGVLGVRSVHLALVGHQAAEGRDHAAAAGEGGAARVGPELAVAREPGGDHRAEEAEGDLRGDEDDVARDEAEERRPAVVVPGGEALRAIMATMWERYSTNAFTTPWMSVMVTMSPFATWAISCARTPSISCLPMARNRPLDTATRLRFFEGPVAKAFTSGES